MKADLKKNFNKAIDNADVLAKRKAFRLGFPYAILEEGRVMLVFPDKHTEPATPELLAALASSN